MAADIISIINCPYPYVRNIHRERYDGLQEKEEWNTAVTNILLISFPLNILVGINIHTGVTISIKLP
jgi:hypothetical protein